MRNRIRTDETVALGGSWYRYQTGHYTSGDAYYQSFWQSTDDWTDKTRRENGFYPPSPFDSSVRFRTPQRISRSYRPRIGRTEIVLNNLVSTHSAHNLAGSPPGGWISSNMEKSDDEYAIQLLAETNPARPSVSIPILISELVEATTLLKITARTLASLGGSTYLNIKFGWATLIYDILTLAQITKHIESRIKEYNSLVLQGGLRRNVTLDNCKATTSVDNITVHSANSTLVKSNIEYTYKSKVYGTVSWVPSNPSVIPTDPIELFNLAIRNVLDLETVDAYTLWEVIPFSWLIDYFLNIGDILLSLESADEFVPYDICIMRHRTAEASYSAGTSSDIGFISCSPGFIREERKIRNVVSAISPYASPVSWSFLNKQQALTLTALLSSLHRRG